jgi:pimeloyl-ACP methyl ester carboxylesterase
MRFMTSEGVELADEDSESDFPPMVLVHGCGLDHRSLAARATFLRVSHRVISVDLRGHGSSDAPRQDYTMQVFGDDLAALCAALGLVKPIVIGHSMGGNIALWLWGAISRTRIGHKQCHPSCGVSTCTMLHGNSAAKQNGMRFEQYQ